jgi:folate-binding Fe-S cluster repair protein YgfZ
VHLHKGCYRGQETVARVHNLGRPPRRLVMLNLDGSVGTLPEPGEPVTSGAGRAVGRLGTIAQHHELGPIALALIKRSVEAGTPLLVGGIDAVVDIDDRLDEGQQQTPLSAIDRRAFTQLRRS